MSQPTWYRSSRWFALFALAALTGCIGHQSNNHHTHTGDARLRVYYAHQDGSTLTAYRVPAGAAQDAESLAYLATVSVLNGPITGVSAIRFPDGTRALSVHVDGSTATVDLSQEVDKTAPGGLSEAGEFKALVWSLTEIPGITRVKIRVGGATLPTLPGGHFELDEPLSRADW